MTYCYYIFLVRLVNVDPDISRRSPVRSRVKTPCYVLRMCPFYGRQRINPGVRLHDYLHTAGAPLQVMLCQLRIMHLDVTDALSQGYNLKWVSTLTITITYYYTLLRNFRPALLNRMVTVVFVLNWMVLFVSVFEWAETHLVKFWSPYTSGLIILGHLVLLFMYNSL